MPAENSGVSARSGPVGEHKEPTGLVREQAHLDQSRAALARMRDRTASMSALAGDRVSGEYLKFTLYKRMKALEDDPEIPLFFGRLDYGGGIGDDRRDAGQDRYYIGRRHVTDESGTPMVIDWRAPVSRPFYRASQTDPMGLRLRRRFGFQHGTLTAYEDEPLSAQTSTGEAPRPADEARDSPDGASGAASGRATTTAPSILEAEIERPRLGPMRDIVATIQPEQDDIVRADLATSVCVQGAPGTGKTAVGLHRAAYLLYAHRDRLSRQGVLVVGPNASFLRYIGDVLPALGEIDARQTTVDDLVAAVKITVVDPTAVAKLKGDARLAEVLHRAVWSSLSAPPEALVVPVGARRWRVPAYQAEEIITELRTRGVRYGAGRALLPQRLASALLAKMELAGDSPDDRIQGSIARSRPVKQYTDSAWPAVDPKRLVARLLSDPAFLDNAAAGILTADEQGVLSQSSRGNAGARPSPAQRPATRKWSLHDAVLVDEARDLIERTPSVGHVVLDEAQDLSPMMLRCVGRHCSTGSVTVLGDLAQATTAFVDSAAWSDRLAHLGKPGAELVELTVGFRVPASVISFAARLLPLIAPDLQEPTSIRQSAGDLVVESVSSSVPAAVNAVQRAMYERVGSVGVIVEDAMAAEMSRALTTARVEHSTIGRDDDIEATVDVVPASLAKGLEFDHVVLVEPAEIVAAEPEETIGLRRLYVCLTRAVMSLVVIHATPLPSLLTEVPSHAAV